MNYDPCYRLDPKFSPPMCHSSSSFFSKFPSKTVALCGQKLNPTNSLTYIEENNEILDNLVSESVQIYKQNFNYDSDLLKKKKSSEANELNDDIENNTKHDVYSSSINFDYNLYSNKPITLRDIQKNQIRRAHSAIPSRYMDTTKIIYNLSKLHSTSKKSAKNSPTCFFFENDKTSSQFF